MELVKQAIDRIIGKTRAELMEHCDSVLILITHRNEDGQSACGAFTSGNFYANRGAAQEWIDAQKGRIVAHEINESQGG